MAIRPSSPFSFFSPPHALISANLHRWPTVGEIDVLEGVNNRAYDSMSIRPSFPLFSLFPSLTPARSTNRYHLRLLSQPFHPYHRQRAPFLSLFLPLTDIPSCEQWASPASKGDDCSTKAGSLCSITDRDLTSYGAGWNAAGGGVFAVMIAENGCVFFRFFRLSRRDGELT
jgi:hypothetical protein